MARTPPHQQPQPQRHRRLLLQRRTRDGQYVAATPELRHHDAVGDDRLREGDRPGPGLVRVVEEVVHGMVEWSTIPKTYSVEEETSYEDVTPDIRTTPARPGGRRTRTAAAGRCRGSSMGSAFRRVLLRPSSDLKSG
jgi:hypothetical protein